MKPARCHPDRKHYAHGFCKQCYHLDYDREWRARQPRKPKKERQPRATKPATCHPRRKHYARGLCLHCYGKARYRDPVTGPQIRARNAALKATEREEIASDQKAREAYLAVRREENRRAALRLQRLRVSGDVESDSGSLPKTG